MSARRDWPPVLTVVAGVVLALSFLPILGVGASGGTKAVLALMHLVVAAALIPVFGKARAYAEAV